MIQYLTVLVIMATCLGCSPDKIENNLLKLSSGRVERFENFNSKFVMPRNVDVWLPDNYSNDEKYAVLYMHDGQMLFDSTTTWNHQEWGVDESVSQLLNANKIRNTIVVGIWNTEFRHSEYFPQKPFENLSTSRQDSFLLSGKRNESTALFKTKVISDSYLKFIVQELKPFIDSSYATYKEFGNTFIAGSSMGGLISMYALCEYPNIFSGAACLSTHWIGSFENENNPIPMLFVEYLDGHLPDAENHKIYFDYGTKTLDAFYEPHQILVDSIMIKNGYTSMDWKTLKFEGDDHSEKSWSERLKIPFTFLLEQKDTK